MANGKLRCCGTSLFLKAKFGAGYKLSIEKGALGLPHVKQAVISDDPEQAEMKIVGGQKIDRKLTNIVKGTITDATLLSNAAGEIQFQLPMSATNKFVSVLSQLDDETEMGNIDSYGLSLTSLEDVFLIAARGESTIPREVKKESAAPSLGGGASLREEDFKRKGLFFRHVQILFLKRWLAFKRDHKAWFFTTILPSLLVFIGFFNIKCTSHNFI